MDVTPRIRPEEARDRIQSGQALLVCAYDSDEKFNAMHLQNAISLRQFHEREQSIPKDRELIFYCAWPKEATSASLAAKYQQMGFTNVKALQGGVEAWKQAGLSTV